MYVPHRIRMLIQPMQLVIIAANMKKIVLVLNSTLQASVVKIMQTPSARPRPAATMKVRVYSTPFYFKFVPNMCVYALECI